MAAKRQLDPETWFALKLFLVLIIVDTLPPRLNRIAKEVLDPKILDMNLEIGVQRDKLCEARDELETL